MNFSFHATIDSLTDFGSCYEPTGEGHYNITTELVWLAINWQSFGEAIMVRIVHKTDEIIKAITLFIKRSIFYFSNLL